MKTRIVAAVCAALVAGGAFAETGYEGYTQYVESDGSQSIDLDFKLSSDMTIECVYEPLQSSTTYQGLFGTRTDANTGDISFFAQGSSRFGCDCQTGGDADCYKTYRRLFDMSRECFLKDRYLMKLTPAEGWTLTDLTTGQSIPKSWNDNARGETWSGETFSTADTAKLFEIRGTTIDGKTWGRAKMRLYLLRVSDSNGKVIHEVVPAQEGDKVGVRDTVTGDCHYPAAGNPLKFGDASPLSVRLNPLTPMPPGDYDGVLDCLISDGRQWIETGVSLDSEMEIDVDCSLLTYGEGGVFGAWDPADPAVSNISVLVDSDKQYSVDFTDGASIGEHRTQWAAKGDIYDLTADVRYNFHLSGMERSVTERETGKEIKKNSKAWDDHPFSTEGTAQIFGVAGMAAHAKMKLYRVKIAKDGVVLHDYRPVLKDGVAGLCDCMTGDFLGNAGEGEFGYTHEGASVCEVAMKSSVKAGVPWQGTATVSTVVWPVDQDAAYVESDGTQEIDLGFKLSSDMNIEVVFAGVGDVPASQGFFGARGNSANVNNIALFRPKDNNGKHTVSADCQNGSYATYRMADVVIGTEVVYRATMKDGAWTLTDATSGVQRGKSKKAWDGTAFETPYTARLFKIGGTTIDDKTWALAKVRIYSVVVRDKDGALLHDLIPSMNAAGVVGMFDRAVPDSADAWKLPKPGAGVNPLVLGNGRIAPNAPHAYTNVIGCVSEPCELSATLSPLRPGTTYGWFAFAEDRLGGFASSPTTNAFTTVAEAVPAGATLSLGAKVVFGEAKAGHLRLKLTRTDTANAAVVTLVAGKNYGGADPATWRNVTALGSFASGEAEIVVDTPFLPADTNYLRAFTADGEWSETVFIPETGFVSRGRGLMLILR